jgi:hypothetical protein
VQSDRNRFAGKSKIVSEKGQTLETEQLYDQKKMSGFTEKV